MLVSQEELARIYNQILQEIWRKRADLRKTSQPRFRWWNGNILYSVGLPDATATLFYSPERLQDGPHPRETFLRIDSTDCSTLP